MLCIEKDGEKGKQRESEREGKKKQRFCKHSEKEREIDLVSKRESDKQRLREILSVEGD